MIKHIYPTQDPKNGIFRYGELIDGVIARLQDKYQNKNIYHVELGYGSYRQLWETYKQQKKQSNYSFVLTLHDPPVVVGKPFEKYFPGNSVLVKAFRKSLDKTIGRYIVKKVVANADAIVVLNHLAIPVVSSSFRVAEKKIFYSPLPPLLMVMGSKTPGNPIKTVLFFGNVSTRKGVELLVGAFKNLSSKYADTRLVIVGGYEKDKAYYDRLNYYARDLLDENKIEFMGFVEDQRLKELITDASIVVLPYYNPGIVHASGPLVTSMAAGKVVIAADIPIFSDVIQNGQTGLLFTEGSEKELEESLNALLSNNQKVAEMSDNAKEYINSHNNVDMIKKSLTEVYNSL